MQKLHAATIFPLCHNETNQLSSEQDHFTDTIPHLDMTDPFLPSLNRRETTLQADRSQAHLTASDNALPSFFVVHIDQ